MTTPGVVRRISATLCLLASALAFAPSAAATIYVYPQMCKFWISLTAYGASSPEAAGLPALDAACAPWGGSLGGYCRSNGSSIASSWGCNTANNLCGTWVSGEPDATQFQYIPGYSFDSCVVASFASDEGDAGKGNGTCKHCAGNPVNFATGNKFQRETDYARTGDALEFYRFYNSRGFNNYIPMGMGWTHAWNRNIQLTGTLALAFRPDGKVWKFNLTGGQWIADADIAERLVQSAGGWQLTLRNDDIELYDAAGRMLSVTSRDGRVTTLAYSDGTAAGANGGTYDNTSTPFKPGLLIRVTDFTGRALRFGYANDITLSSVTDPNGGVYRYGYVAGTGNNKMLASVQYPDGHSRTYQYAEAGAVYSSANVAVSPVPAEMFWALTGITDDGVRFASFTYWNNGKTRSTEHAGGVERYDFPYQTQGTSIYHTPLGAVRKTQNTMILDVVQTTGITQDCPGCGGTASESYTYDANGNATSHADFNGNLECASFDTARNLELSRTEGLSGTCSAPITTSATRTITTQWHPAWRVPQRTAQPLRITTFAYNGDPGASCAPAGASTALVCSKTVQATTDGTGALAFGATADGAARTWSYTYNASGQVLTVRGPRSDVTDVTTYSYYAANDVSGNFRAGDLQSVTNALGHSTQFTNYDAAGRLARSVDPNGLETLMTYWPRGWLKSRQAGTAAAGYETTSYAYDAVGNLTQVTMPDGSTVSYTYDAAYRLTDVRDGLGNHIQYTLDNAGNRIAEAAYDTTGALARAHSRTFDVLSRLANDIGGTSPSQQVAVNGYDANGNLRTITDPLSRVTTQLYDSRNRLTETRDPFNGVAAPTRYEYNGLDALTKVTDPGALATTYTMNGYGELLAQSSPDTGMTSFTYDEASNLVSKLDARNVLASYSYDAFNRLKQVTYPDETVVYTYDACGNGIGRLCSIADKTGTTTYAYDIHGRITAKTQAMAGLSRTMGYTYNAAGQLSKVTLPSGKQITYAYSNNRPVSVTLDGTNVLNSVFYEPFGPNGGWLWGNGTPAAPNTHTRVYDRDFRMTRVTSDQPANAGQPSFDRRIVWNANVSRVQAVNDLATPALNATYDYDALDRLTNAVQGTTTRAYSYNGTGDRLTSAVNGATTSYGYYAGTHQLQGLSGAQTKAYVVDLAGNMTSDGTTSWTYGGNNRPTQAGSVAFDINALGQRVRKVSGAATTYFVYDESGRLWGEYGAAGTPIAETLWLDDLPVAVIK